jgi:hypothetical protein
MNNKLFTIAGTSTLNGVDTFRFATGKIKVRENKLAKTGHSNIALQMLPEPMTKQDAIAFLQSNGVHAVMPVKRHSAKAVGMTEEQIAAAEAAKKAAFVARMAEARAAKAAAKQAEEDAMFIANMGATALLAAADADTAVEG